MSAARRLILRGCAMIALPLAAASPAAAQQEGAAPRAVFSDTAEASRVRIELAGSGFQLERVGPRLVDLTIERPIEIFDPANPAGAAGPVRRIASVRRAPAESGFRLRFVLTCACDYAAKLWDGELMVEFRDPGRSAGAESASPETTPASTPVAEASPARRAEGTAQAPRFAPSPATRAGAATEVAEAASAEEDPQALEESVIEPDESRREEILIARRRLLEQLAKAADQGLLEFSSPEAAEEAPGVLAPASHEGRDVKTARGETETADAPPAAPVEPPKETAAAEAPEPEIAEETPPRAKVELPVRVRTATERAFRTDRADSVARVTPCVEPRLAALSWPTDLPFAKALAAHVAALLDETDEPVAGAAAALARLYIAHGFGFEARAALASLDDRPEETSLLADLARIVEGEAPAPSGPLATSGVCGGWSALWSHAAGLDQAEAPAAAGSAYEIAREDMLEVFERAPRPLRAILAPPAMLDLIGRGDIDAARRIDLLMRRTDGEFGPPFDLARARLLAATGEIEDAEALFARLGRRDLPESRDALLMLFESLAARGGPITVELADALGDAAFIARGEAAERALRVAEAEARFVAEGLPQALAALEEGFARRPDDRVILRDAGHAVLERADAARDGPLAYARAVFGYRGRISADQSGDAARRRVGDELTGIGLANAALRILEPAMARGAPVVRRAAARAMMAIGDAGGALAALEGSEGPETDRLRVAALVERDQPGDAAAAAAIETGEPPAARVARAFRAGDWSIAALDGETPERALAAFMAGREETAAGARLTAATADAVASDDRAAAILAPAAPADAKVTLEGARSVVDQSEDVRSLIEEVLSDG